MLVHDIEYHWVDVLLLLSVHFLLLTQTLLQFLDLCFKGLSMLSNIGMRDYHTNIVIDMKQTCWEDSLNSWSKLLSFCSYWLICSSCLFCSSKPTCLKVFWKRRTDYCQVHQINPFSFQCNNSDLMFEDIRVTKAEKVARILIMQYRSDFLMEIETVELQE